MNLKISIRQSKNNLIGLIGEWKAEEWLKEQGYEILPKIYPNTHARARLATQPPGILTGLLLIDIGLTFEQPVGVMGQIRTSSFLISRLRITDGHTQHQIQT